MHLINIGVKNFRVFKNYKSFELKPITLLTGPNNSGKSSLLKAIMLLKDTFSNYPNSYFKERINYETPEFYYDYSEPIEHNIPIELDLKNSSRHNLGEFSTIITKGKNKKLSFTLPFLIPELSSKKTYALNLVYRKEKLRNIIDGFTIKDGSTNLLKISYLEKNNKNTKIRVQLNSKKLLEYFNEGKINLVDRTEDNIDIIDFICSLGIEGSIYDNSDIFRNYGYYYFPEVLKEPIDKAHIFTISDHNKNKLNANMLVHFYEKENIFLRNKNEIVFDWEYDGNKLPSIASMLINFFEFEMLKIDLKTTIPITKYTELGLVIIGLLDRALSFNLKNYHELFKNCMVFQNMDLRYDHPVDNKSDLFFLIQKIVELEDTARDTNSEERLFMEPYSFMHDMLKKIGIPGHLIINNIKGYGYEIAFKTKEGQIPLKNCGYGIIKIVTLILDITAIAFNNKTNDVISKGFSQTIPKTVDYDPSILILEEPESNIHPKLQSVLAEIILIAASKFNIQFIIETHSEYIVRKFQYLVAYKKNGFKNGHINIYYFEDSFEHNAGEDFVFELGMRPDGILKRDFGPGFFDESLRLTAELLKLQNNN